MGLTRKNFKEYAAKLKDKRPDPKDRAAYGRWLEEVDTAISFLATTNPAFDRGRFKTACGA